nr:MAG TPA: hypothetical protein [Caudoviricetes sp.]
MFPRRPLSPLCMVGVLHNSRHICYQSLDYSSFTFTMYTFNFQGSILRGFLVLPSF